MNPVEIDDAVSALAEQPFNPGEFAYEFLRAFGNPETTIKRLRTGSTNQSDVEAAVLQRSNVHIATCAPGAVDATLKALRDSPKTASAKAKFIVATDGDEFQAEDLTSGETVACPFPQFPDHFGFFLPLAGITTVPQVRESSFDIKATGRLNRLYVQLLTDNPEWRTVERRADMNHFMARLIFCFFAEDTDIFVGEGLFTKTVEQMSARDASDTHVIVGEVFRSMDTKLADRQAAKVPRYANQFPYVNGQLFSGSTEAPRFSKIARSYLLHIGALNWRKINPDIFGSMIQAVADDEERGALGMHYTSVPNILKVLNPLLLDDLRAKLEEAGDNGRKLLNLRNRMARIRVFDPACGSGNFLVIAYKEIRALEAEVNRRRGEPDRRSDIPLTNFRGIELRDFPAEIARLALIIAEYQANVLYRGQQEALAEFLPLDSQNWITCGNALRLDWLSICPPAASGVKVVADDLFHTPLKQAEIDFEHDGGETYLCGNPPYKGSQSQDDAQKADLKAALLGSSINWKGADFVSGWFFKAAQYCRREHASFAFVSTNSISQGKAVSGLWPSILGETLQIQFAYSSFKWSNLASNNAGVMVVIIGVGSVSNKANKMIFSINADQTIDVREVSNINAYLAAGPSIFVEARSANLSGLPQMAFGNMPIDGGHLSFTRDEMSAVSRAAVQRGFLRRIYGAAEYIRGLSRYALWVNDKDVGEIADDPVLAERLRKVRQFREASNRDATSDLADQPHRFGWIAQRGDEVVTILPRILSERRDYITVGYESQGALTTDQAYTLCDAPLWSLAILSSRIHLVWIATVCGRLKTDLRYSNTLGWNTFPIPKLIEQHKVDLTRKAEAILLIREAHFPKTISELYNPDEMPDDLRRAHEANDEVLERIYIGRRFRNDTERLEKLFDLYTKMTVKKAA